MSDCKVVRVDVSLNFTDFISKRVKDIVSQDKKVTVVFPNLRPLRFVERNLTPQEVLKADFYSMADFVKNGVLNFSPTPPVFQDETDRLFFILNILKKTGGVSSENETLYEKLGNDDSLVFPWVRRLSALFSEIDKQLIDNVKDFQYFDDTVEEAKELLENLGALFQEYKREKERLNVTYGGDIYRRFVEIVKSDKFVEANRGRVFLFCGFAYLTKSEKEIISSIKDCFDTEIYFHSDTENRHFITKDYFNVYGIYDSWVKGDFWKEKCSTLKGKKTETDIEFYESYDVHSQVRQVAEKIKEIVEKNSLCSKLNHPETIGVILPDSKTLLPLLFYFPELCGGNINKNITLSFPFNKTGLGDFLNGIFKVVLEMQKDEGRKVYTPFLIRVLRNEVFSLLKIESKVSINNVVAFLIEKNIVFLDFSDNSLLKEKQDVYYFLFHVFEKLIKPFYNAESIDTLLKAFESFYSMIDKKKLQSDIFKYERIVFEQFYSQVVSRLEALKFSEFARNIDFNARLFYSLISVLAKNVSIPFEGNPLKGVQIMGMLEARSLSFDYLFILDVNEGIVPSAEKIDPLMPESLKVELGLSGFKERERLFRYNFFRLVDSSKKAFIFYQSGNTTLDKKVRSRFVEQLIFEKQIRFNFDSEKEIVKKSSIYFTGKEKRDGIEKEDWIQKEILSFFKGGRKISPTFIDDYLNCPYYFYLKRIAKIDERIQLNEEQRADIVGSLIHFVLEKGFAPFKGEWINQNMLEQIRELVVKEVKNFIEFSGFKTLNSADDREIERIRDYFSHLDKTKREILKTVAEFRLKALFDFFNNQLKKCEIQLIDFEKEILTRIKIGSGLNCNLYGIIDRIEYVCEKNKGGEDYFKIVDYKTGKYARTPPSKFWRISDITERINEKKNFDGRDIDLLKDYIHSIQLPFYIYLYRSGENNNAYNIKSSLYMLGKKEREIEAKFSIDWDKLPDFDDFFNDILNTIFHHMIKSEKIYALSGSSCKFCQYNHFCEFAK